MRKFSLCLAALFVFTVAAQAEPKAEIFGGYQYTRFEGGINWNGWNAAVTGNMGRFFGVTADFSQVYNSGVHYTTYTFGPEVHAHLPIVKPFVHALVGGARFAPTGFSTSAGGSGSGGSENGFAMYFGGGVDAGHGPLALRIAQFDWHDFRFYGLNSSKNVRISTGLVVRF